MELLHASDGTTSPKSRVFRQERMKLPETPFFVRIGYIGREPISSASAERADYAAGPAIALRRNELAELDVATIQRLER